MWVVFAGQGLERMMRIGARARGLEGASLRRRFIKSIDNNPYNRRQTIVSFTGAGLHNRDSITASSARILLMQTLGWTAGEQGGLKAVCA